MKQPQYSPMSVADQAITLFAVSKGFFDGVEVKKALAFESGMRQHVHAKFKALVDRIETTKDLTADDEKALADAIETSRRTARTDRKPGAVMPGIKEIRVKIKSVQNTRKITKAMEMVAASKMKKAQERMRAGRPMRSASSASRCTPRRRTPSTVIRC